MYESSVYFQGHSLIFFLNYTHHLNTSSGFMEIKISGEICIINSRCSRVWAGFIFEFDVVFPACVDRNICRE